MIIRNIIVEILTTWTKFIKENSVQNKHNIPSPFQNYSSIIWVVVT